MKPLLVQSPILVDSELDNLGLTRSGLLEAIACGVAARDNCTENDPPAARGWKFWCDTTRRLREVFFNQGWEKNEDGHMSSLYNPERNIKILVSNTDDATGLELDDRQPQNRNRKGPGTDRLVAMNRLSLFEFFNVADPREITSIGQGDTQHWFLCVHCEKGVVRAELSYPDLCEGGFFTTFQKRIILIGADRDEDNTPRIQRTGPDGDSDLEINVTRRIA